MPYKPPPSAFARCLRTGSMHLRACGLCWTISSVSVCRCPRMPHPRRASGAAPAAAAAAPAAVATSGETQQPAAPKRYGAHSSVGEAAAGAARRRAHSRAKPYLEPIDGGAGQDCRYEESHVAMRALISQMDNQRLRQLLVRGCRHWRDDPQVSRGSPHCELPRMRFTRRVVSTVWLQVLRCDWCLGVLGWSFSSTKAYSRKNAARLVEQLEPPLSEMIQQRAEKAISLLETAVAIQSWFTKSVIPRRRFGR